MVVNDTLVPCFNKEVLREARKNKPLPTKQIAISQARFIVLFKEVQEMYGI
jgi:hypothetical protein